MTEAIVTGVAITVIGGAVGILSWLTRTRVERAEQDIQRLINGKAPLDAVKRLEVEKASLAVCGVMHVNLDRRLDEMRAEHREGQAEIFSSLNGLRADVAALKGKVE